MTKTVNIKWNGLEVYVNELCDMITKDCRDRGSTPKETFEGIYGIPRGGLIIAVMMSHKLDIKYIDRLNEMYGKKFLVVDDIADTGHTLRSMKAEVFDHAQFATIHYHKDSVVEPDYWVKQKDNDWIIYPWENLDSKHIQDYKL
tara:strand:+ start:1011 stop:1442 length:432 start_codon:yes stop_codon:yes gene_type:complete